ncbi:hypothetical protein Tdes44962_MAKER02211 [Teratosphaeria destructans]|uniref:Uncharacterized protein n=1 Tax=Teratosphaeria destructans TaxID=418781 RepID=A0A9W7SUE1_9PEZI|nr:hypothetical protein Tdes44962_MAKER02211 [Teratosphaeria destructans]
MKLATTTTTTTLLALLTSTSFGWRCEKDTQGGDGVCNPEQADKEGLEYDPGYQNCHEWHGCKETGTICDPYVLFPLPGTPYEVSKARCS